MIKVQKHIPDFQNHYFSSNSLIHVSLDNLNALNPSFFTINKKIIAPISSKCCTGNPGDVHKSIVRAGHIPFPSLLISNGQEFRVAFPSHAFTLMMQIHTITCTYESCV